MNKKICTTSQNESVCNALENRFASYQFEIRDSYVWVLDVSDVRDLDEMKEFVNGYKSGFFYRAEMESVELAALRAENAELREALIKAESALTYANWDGTFDDNHTTQDVIKARDNARVVLEKFAK